MRKPLTPALTALALGEPILPVGFRRDGRPIFPIAGGAPDDPPPSDPPPNDPPPSDPPAWTPPASQADLDRIIGERVARERAKYADYQDVKAKAEAHDKALEAAKSESERAVDAARKEGETSALERVNARLVKSEVRAAAAAARFRDPADAIAHISVGDIKVGDDGEVDQAAIKAALDNLAESKPYLVDDGKRTPPKSDPSQGGGGTKRTGLTGMRGDDLYDRLHPKSS